MRPLGFDKHGCPVSAWDTFDKITLRMPLEKSESESKLVVKISDQNNSAKNSRQQGTYSTSMFVLQSLSCSSCYLTL